MHKSCFCYSRCSHMQNILSWGLSNLFLIAVILFVWDLSVKLLETFLWRGSALLWNFSFSCPWLLRETCYSLEPVSFLHSWWYTVKSILEENHLFPIINFEENVRCLSNRKVEETLEEWLLIFFAPITDFDSELLLLLTQFWKILKFNNFLFTGMLTSVAIVFDYFEFCHFHVIGPSIREISFVFWVCELYVVICEQLLEQSAKFVHIVGVFLLIHCLDKLSNFLDWDFPELHLQLI